MTDVVEPNSNSALPEPKPDAPRETRKTAALILEVLAGMRSPTEAAEALAISVNHYYILEDKALKGFVEALEPKPRGRKWTEAHELAAVIKEREQLKRECGRYQTLARLAQRSLGVKPPSAPPAKTKGKRRRKPMVRALKAATQIKAEESSS